MEKSIVNMGAFRAAKHLPDQIAQLRLVKAGNPDVDDIGTSKPFCEAIGAVTPANLLAIAEALSQPGGSAFVVNLYKAWLLFFEQHPEKKTANAAVMSAIWFNLGTEYGHLGDVLNKVKCYNQSIELKPDFYPAVVNLALTYEAGNQMDLALAALQRGLQTDEARTMILNNLGRIRENASKLEEAKRDYTTSLMTVPDQIPVLHHLVGLRAKTCDWPTHALTIPGLTQSAMMKATRALTLLAMCDDVKLQREGNATWVQEKMPAVAVPLKSRTREGREKIRLGYLSSDLCMHPIAFLIAELLETHDRGKFEVHGFCSTKEDNSPVRQRIVSSFDVFHDIRNMTDEQAAVLVNDQNIDILIDLNGLTLGTRLQILRYRPAPIQITYLGYNGPIPVPELDFIIADRYVIPTGMAKEYGPRPLYMSKCFQVNDSKLPIQHDVTRRDAGLPEDKFIFCCFSNTYKVTEDIFSAWMTILARTQDTVLWLYVDNEEAKRNLSRVAAAQGIDSARIIYASRVESSLYRGRLALADLFLDTFPYNAGTTASDALRVGLPIVTISGESFISRMAGSLLQVMGIEEGIVSKRDDYIELSIQLATDAARYQRLRASVTPEKWRDTLGDTPGFCKELETKFESLIETLC